MKLMSVGFGNYINAARVVAIVGPEAAPVKRLMAEARARGMLIDATSGRRTRAVLVCDSDHVVLSAAQPETLAARAGAGGEGADTAEKAGDEDE